MVPNTNQEISYSEKGYKLIILLMLLISLGLGVWNIYQETTYTQKIQMKENLYTSEIRKLKESNDCSQCTQSPIVSAPGWPEGETKVYNSDTLGISFSYYQAKNVLRGQEYKIVEEKNRIYFGTVGSLDMTEGVFIEAFQKRPSQNISDEIKQKFVKREYLDKCVVEKIQEHGNIINPTYEYLYIHSPYNENNEVIDNSIWCSDITYLQGHFITDKGHPNKYVFLHEGQSSFGFLPGYEGASMPAEYSISFY